MSQQEAQYNNIANQYQTQRQQSEFVKEIEEFSFIKLLGDVKGKDVLDVACGEGAYTRIIKRELHANRVMGIDISEKMIELAKIQEHNIPESEQIKYEVKDAADLGQCDNGNFDVVTATFLLHYASSEMQLQAFCDEIAKQLKKNGKGRLVALVENMHDNPSKKWEHKPYGFVKHVPNTPRKNGDIIVLEYMEPYPFKFSIYSWDQSLYETCLRKAGFTNIAWDKPSVSNNGISLHNNNIAYWQSFLDNPSFLILTATTI